MSREAIQMALEALEANLGNWAAKTKAIPVLRQALEEKQEPLCWTVADGWVYPDDTSENHVDEKAKREHEWVGLTEEETDELSRSMVKGDKSVNWLCRAIEAKLKEKNYEPHPSPDKR